MRFNFNLFLISDDAVALWTLIAKLTKAALDQWYAMNPSPLGKNFS
jgi:hypothetical protein